MLLRTATSEADAVSEGDQFPRTREEEEWAGRRRPRSFRPLEKRTGDLCAAAGLRNQGGHLPFRAAGQQALHLCQVCRCWRAMYATVASLAYYYIFHVVSCTIYARNYIGSSRPPAPEPESRLPCREQVRGV